MFEYPSIEYRESADNVIVARSTSFDHKLCYIFIWGLENQEIARQVIYVNRDNKEFYNYEINQFVNYVQKWEEIKTDNFNTRRFNKPFGLRVLPFDPV